MDVGYEKDLLILPFDHRGTFAKKMPGMAALPEQEQSRRICGLKEIVYEAYKLAVRQGLGKEVSGILVDEQYGSEILIDARKQGFLFALTAEKSAQDEFDFEYGEKYAEHLEKFAPTFVKVLVRYNPDGSPNPNMRQLDRLKKLSDYCAKSKIKLLFELIVEPTEEQLMDVKGDKRRFDRELRGKLMLRGIKNVHDAGIAPHVWKLEGLEKRDEVAAVAREVRADGSKSGIIVLGRGETDEKVKEWLLAAAGVEGVIGFAVGRTVFWKPLELYFQGKINREEAVKLIAGNYKAFVDFWNLAKSQALSK